MSESFQSALRKVNYGKYIEQIQEELKKAVANAGPGKSLQQAEAVQMKVQELIRRQSRELAKEVGFVGNNVMVFMTATAILATAWVSFMLRKETSDLSKSPEDRLATIEVLDALDLALGNVIASAINYADTYPSSSAGGTQPQQPPESRGPGDSELKK